ncbi:TPM domain-containing protein [Leptospira meyeri]|uniref:TPM domain-containing protein n=1 Tax=Leptospira meyeri TaxID=29508 RepID=UPI001082B88A|nr:TPM domain-containing protein [Leptospira meyeri]TGM23742.1 TPM domain-containing protein [Leptospira meyeri]
MKCFPLLSLILFCSFCNLIKDPYPELTGPVVDPTGFLPNEVKIELEKRLLEEENKTTNQLVIYITDSLEKNTIEEEAIAVFEKWKLGSKDKDNGVLLLLAPKNRKVRIEVGYGLEDILTDILSKRIIDEIIIPHMKSGNSSEGVRLGTMAILDQLSTGSASFLETNCPETFNDVKKELHADTIPLLKKEIRTLSNLHFQFCVLPSETTWGLEAKATKLLLNNENTKENKNKVVFVVSPKNGFMGTIVTSPELGWSLSRNKINTIFNRRYEEKQQSDFTNYSYLSFLDMLNYLKHKNKQVITEGTGIYDPHDVLETFSFERAKETVNDIETNYKIKTQILFLDTKSDLALEAKKFHYLAFKNLPAITILFSLNWKELYVYTDHNTFLPFASNDPENEQKLLNSKIRSEIEADLKSGDIDWICIRAAEATNYFLYHLTKLDPSQKENSKKETVKPTLEPHFLWKLYFALSFLIGFLGFIGGEGFLFFNASFFILWQKIRLHTSFLYDSPNIYQTISFFSSIFLALILVVIFRKLGWSNKVHSALTNFMTSPSSGGSGSSSGSSYRSSSSSYSGGGGRSGGGGASGSW